MNRSILRATSKQEVDWEIRLIENISGTEATNNS